MLSESNARSLKAKSPTRLYERIRPFVKRVRLCNESTVPIQSRVSCHQRTHRRTPMDVYEAIRTRLTVREFKPDPVPDDVVDKLVRAGQWTASSRNLQPWHFIVNQRPRHARQYRRHRLIRPLRRRRANGDRHCDGERRPRRPRRRTRHAADRARSLGRRLGPASSASASPSSATIGSHEQF